jgi:L-fuconolactonase
VVRLAGDYKSWFDQCRDMVSNDHHTAVFGGNAIDFYRLNR